MRVLMTTDTIGGVWTYTKELAAELLVRGCSVALVSLGRAPSDEQLEWAATLTLQYGEAFFFTASDAPLEWMEENERAFDAAEGLLLDLARQFGASLFLSSQYCFGALPCNCARVVVAHSDVLSWARACRQQPLAPSAWLDQYCSLVRQGLARADAVVAPTRWMLGALANGFRLPGNSLVIPNGRSVASPPSCERRFLQAVTAGRLWDEAKNLSMLADVISTMPLLVAGEEEHESSALGSPLPTAQMLGRLEEDDLVALFRQSAIYLCPSLYEPFGLAPLEAALCGCAVVANDIPSLREVWGDSALFFQDSESLSCLLERLSRDGNFLGQAQLRSLLRARRYSASSMAGAYFNLFQSLLAHAEARRVA
jgi:glycosyltransferase involved in cell wall biosynthesis